MSDGDRSTTLSSFLLPREVEILIVVVVPATVVSLLFGEWYWGYPGWWWRSLRDTNRSLISGGEEGEIMISHLTAPPHRRERMSDSSLARIATTIRVTPNTTLPTVRTPLLPVPPQLSISPPLWINEMDERAVDLSPSDLTYATAVSTATYTSVCNTLVSQLERTKVSSLATIQLRSACWCTWSLQESGELIIMLVRCFNSRRRGTLTLLALHCPVIGGGKWRRYRWDVAAEVAGVGVGVGG